MRAILIDPTARTVTEITLPDGKGDTVREAIGCQNLDCIHLSDDIDMWIDDEGLSAITRGAGDQVTSDFFVLQSEGEAHNLIAGKAIVLGNGDDGCWHDLPTKFTPCFIKQFIRFIPDDKRNSAATLADELLDMSGVITAENISKMRASHMAIMVHAMEIALLNPFTCHDEHLSATAAA